MNIRYENKVAITEELKNEAIKAKEMLLNGTGIGANMTGWLDYPSRITDTQFDMINKHAEAIRGKARVLVVVGIGGSYLGTKAVLSTISGYYNMDMGPISLIYAGHTLSATYMNEMLDFLRNKDFCINYVSKSGTTLEPAIAFRLLKELLIKKYGNRYNERIYVTTDPYDGNALLEAKENGYCILDIPKNIGGRYSVITNATLLPAAVLGVDIRSFINGAKKASYDSINNDFDKNIAMKYALYRNINYRMGKTMEIFCVNTLRLRNVAAWYEQLFGESEGKNKKGLYPTSLIYSTNLHSMGQFIQDGSRVMFETFLKIGKSRNNVVIPFDEENMDGLNYIAGKRLQDINDTMIEATILAHDKNNDPNIVLEIEEMDEYHLGYLMYTLMFSCALSAYILGVNPFDQPAVQEYKDIMFSLLDKPGFENLGKEMREKIENYLERDK